MINENVKPIAGDIGEQDFQQPSQQPDTEINPGEVGNNTEVDLDTTKIENYPNQPNEQQ